VIARVMYVLAAVMVMGCQVDAGITDIIPDTKPVAPAPSAVPPPAITPPVAAPAPEAAPASTSRPQPVKQTKCIMVYDAKLQKEVQRCRTITVHAPYDATPVPKK